MGSDCTVQALLEERFGLVLDKAVLERDVYALLPARSDDRLGPQTVRRAEKECRARFSGCGTMSGAAPRG